MSDALKRWWMILAWVIGGGASVLAVLGVVSLWHLPIGLYVFGMYSWLIFRNSRNLVQSIGPIYWFVGDVASNLPTIGTRVRMRERSEPWRRGVGYAVILTPNTMIEIGFCRRHPPASEEELLTIRTLDWEPEHIQGSLTNRWRAGKKAS